MVRDPSLLHPRHRATLVGHERAEETVRQASEAGRMHHAWLVGGPEGIGKATFAYRVARFLLASPAERTGVGLAVDPGGRTARQIAARSHPNLLVLERASAEGDKAAPRTIPVEAVRKVGMFFGSTAADGGHRVCIVDAVEDLTTHGVNALLKSVEEPPLRTTILMVSHAPRRVLPTIRSRCMRLDLLPLDLTTVTEALRSLDLADASPDAIDRAAGRSAGSVARAVSLLDGRRHALLTELETVLDTLPALSEARLLALSDKLADRKAEEDWPLALDTVQRWITERVRAGQGRGARRLAPLAEVCDKLSEGARVVETYNLDRRPFVLSLFGELADAVRLSA